MAFAIETKNPFSFLFLKFIFRIREQAQVQQLVEAAWKKSQKSPTPNSLTFAANEPLFENTQ